MKEVQQLDYPLPSIANGRSLSAQVYDYFIDQLISGKIQFGDRLNIKEIAAKLDVSSMPIRDAIKRLEQEKIVVVNPRSHCYVRVPSKQDVLDAIDARRMLEHFAVELLHTHIRLDEMVRLDSILSDMATITGGVSWQVSSEHLRSYIELDRQFHAELCALTRNSYLLHFYKHVNICLNMSFTYGDGMCHGLETTYGEHRLLVQHLKAHSPEALSIIDSHLMKSKSNIMNEPAFLALRD